MKLYCIYDKVAQNYGAPTVQVNDPVAKRWFNAILSENPYSPSDFDLCYLGEYENFTGLITASMPVVIAHGQILEDNQDA